MTVKKQDLLKHLPKVDKVLGKDILKEYKGNPFILEIVRNLIDIKRDDILNNHIDSVPDAGKLASEVLEIFEKRFDSKLKRVLNGTGIIIHTNLGRSPLSECAISAMVQAARGYSSLEYDLKKGRRGSRHDLVRHLLIEMTGAEDALVTNNNASALLLALTALSKDKEVIVSRGQLVEIGGSFRIPDVCEAGGAILREVGTTNRTRIADYKNAICENSGVLLTVHRSNYRIEGFTEDASLEELVELASESGLPLVNDLGSGAFLDPADLTAMGHEPKVADLVKTGVEVTTFSGDKLLGGPQAGIAVGNMREIEIMRKHPLMRAVRPDKLTFSALEATLREYLKPESTIENIPIWKMMTLGLEELNTRGKEILESIENESKAVGISLEILDSDGYSGGGSLPTQVLKSRAIAFKGSGSKLEKLQKVLRSASPAIVGYIKEENFLLDIRTLYREDVREIINILRVSLKNM